MADRRRALPGDYGLAEVLHQFVTQRQNGIGVHWELLAPCWRTNASAVACATGDCKSHNESPATRTSPSSPRCITEKHRQEITIGLWHRKMNDSEH